MGGWSLTLQSLKALGGGFEGGGESGRGGVMGCEADEAKKGGGKYAVFYFAGK